ncbi:MAG TPA: hypothetical protein VL263_09930 [Vicinamibacterales bacterium]|nr:hypothetical protein [Vicinamibacterales bacterium]
MSTVPAAIAPRQADTDATLLPIHEVALFLRTHLGKKTTAYLSGVTDPKMVTHWIARHNTPRERPQMRLREAYRAAELLVVAHGDEAAKAWFVGSNAELGDQAPAYVIRNASTWEDLRLVLPAARAFAGVLR